MANLAIDKYFLEKYPSCVVIDTTDICNLTCKMCHQNSDSFVPDKNPHISVKLIERLIPLLKKSGSVYLLGAGEPLVHPNIYEIVLKIKTECPDTYVAFTSNGTLLNERNINRLIESKLDMVSFSLDGPKLERGHQKAEVTYKNIRNLAKRKIELGVSNPIIHLGIVLGKDNEKELIPLIEFGIEVGAKSITVEPLRIVAPNPEWDDYIRANNLYDHKETIIPIFKQAKELATKNNIQINTPYLVGVS